MSLPREIRRISETLVPEIAFAISRGERSPRLRREASEAISLLGIASSQVPRNDNFLLLI